MRRHPHRSPRPSMFALALGALVFSLALAACGPTISSRPPAQSPQATQAPRQMVATFRVADRETYRILLISEENIAIARKLLAGEAAPPIPNGKIVRGDPDVNVGYSWHIDPATLHFADMTTEVCDGLPSFVEDGTITSDYFCPWAAKIIALDPH